MALILWRLRRFADVFAKPVVLEGVLYQLYVILSIEFVRVGRFLLILDHSGLVTS